MDVLAEITHEPLKLCRENPIVVNIDAAPVTIIDRSKLRYILQLFVPEFYLAGTYENVEEYQATEEPIYQIAGTSVVPGAFVEIQQFLESLLFTCSPEFEQKKISVCDGMTTPYYTNALIKNDGVLVSSVQSNTAYAFNGGVSMRDYSDYKDTFFTNFIGKDRRFLTYQANEKKVLPKSQEFLYFITNFSPLPTVLKIRVKVTYADNSNETITAQIFQGITAFTVYCLPVGPTILGLDELPNTVEHYEVWVSNENNEAISEVRKYVLDIKYYKNVKQIIFSGSLGNYDTLTCVGKSTENFKVQKQISNRYLGFDYLPNFSEKVVSKITGERELIVNTGWITKAQGEYLTELLLSREIFIASDREFLPMTLTNDTYTTSDTDEFMVGREFTFSYTNPERNYSNLPIAPPSVVQPTGWRSYIVGSCLLDANGIRTGRQGVAMIEKYYINNNQSVRPQVIKRNIAGTEGYIDSIQSSACDVTPFLNTAIVRDGSYLRTNCGGGFGGGKAVITIPANIYGSEISQADADNKAEGAFERTDTQAFADLNGACLASPEFYQVIVPNGKWNYRFQDETTGGTQNIFAGGPGSANNDHALIAYGNAWFIQNNYNINSLIFPQNTNNMVLPLDGLLNYRVYVNGFNVPKRLRVWVDGTLIHDYTISAAEFQASGSQYQFVMNYANGFMPLPNKAMVYALVTNP